MDFAEEKMKSHKTDESSKQLLADLKQLLAPLGVRLIWADATPPREFAAWRFCSKQDPSKIASMETADGVSILGYRELETLHSDLCSEISKILVDGQCVVNPYLGCRSLEEMQIRCDLLGA